MSNQYLTSPEGGPRLLDRVRDALRQRHYSYRTEQSYIHWIKRYIYFHDKKHPAEMGATEVTGFLTYLARERTVAAATQNQALSALLFLYGGVLAVKLPWMDGIVRAKRPIKVPIVLTCDEVSALLGHMEGTKWLMASLLYGAGLRLRECLKLRVKDVDFAFSQIVVREGKGAKDRVSMLPQSLMDPLRNHLVRVKRLHDRDLADGFGDVELPYAIERKYPCAGRDWGWQYVFPSTKLSTDPRSGVIRRHHIFDSVLPRAVSAAARTAGFLKPVGCHVRAVRLLHTSCIVVTISAQCRNSSAMRTCPPQ